MPQFKSKVANLSTELSSYTSAFSSRGWTLAGESRSDGTIAVNVKDTTGGLLRAVGEGQSVKDACNDAAARVGIPGAPTFP